jgi:ligand-binding sensor domain-containing protein
MRSRIAILFLVLPAVVTLASPARPVRTATAPTATPEYGVDFWREAEGLSQSRIRCITQTKDGYLWLGTDNGLVRFNGSSFTAFTVETGSLRDNEVWGLQEDNEADSGSALRRRTQPF